MQTLIFNTVEKTTKLFLGPRQDVGTLIEEYNFKDVSTVSIREGYYEIMQKKEINNQHNGKNITIPVARLPISQTNMIIINE